MRCGSITYRRKFLTSISCGDIKDPEWEEIGITMFMDEGDLANGITAEKVFKLAKKFVFDHAHNADTRNEMIKEKEEENGLREQPSKGS